MTIKLRCCLRYFMHKQLLVLFYGLLTVSELFATDDGMQCSTGYSLASTSTSIAAGLKIT